MHDHQNGTLSVNHYIYIIVIVIVICVFLSRYLNGPLPYVRRNITVNKCVECVVKYFLPSFFDILVNKSLSALLNIILFSYSAFINRLNFIS